MYDIANAIGQGIVDQATYVGTLSTAIFGAMVALRLQFKLTRASERPVVWLPAFWIATVLAVHTIGSVVAISGLMIELTPVFYAFPFDTGKEFSAHNFDGTRIGVLKWFGRIQLGTFLLLLLCAGAFILKNLSSDTTPPLQKGS